MLNGYVRSALGFGFILILAQDVHAASFRGLGSFASVRPYSRAAGISADGKTVVGDSVGSVFLWDEQSGLRSLDGRLEPQLPASAFAISADGTTVAAAEQQAVLWTADGGWRGLGYLSGSGALSLPLGLSADGSVAVGRTLEGPTIQAFRWEEQTGMRGLGYLPGTNRSGASAVSADGSRIVGHSQLRTISVFTSQAFVWDELSGMQPIPGLIPGETAIDATAISSDGRTILGYAVAESGLTEAFRWDGQNGPESLGRLDFGDPSPLAISGDGQIIVGYHLQNRAAERDAFIWDAEHGMRSLQDYLVSLGVDLGGWTLWSATGISEDGTTIVGFGRHPGGWQEGFIAVIPEPTTGLLVSLGLGLLAARAPHRVNRPRGTRAPCPRSDRSR